MPAQQHRALLAVAGHGGATPPTVGWLAEQLLIAPHTAVELVARMVAADLLTKTRSLLDRRRMELAPTAKAEILLRSLTEAHLRELRPMEPTLARAFVLSREAEHLPERSIPPPAAPS